MKILTFGFTNFRLASLSMLLLKHLFVEVTSYQMETVATFYLPTQCGNEQINMVYFSVKFLKL